MMRLGIMDLMATLSISIERHSGDCHYWCHDTQHNNVQYNDDQHNDTENNDTR